MKTIYRVIVNSVDLFGGTGWSDALVPLQSLLQLPIDPNRHSVYCCVESFVMDCYAGYPLSVCIPTLPLSDPPYFTSEDRPKNIILTTLGPEFQNPVYDDLHGYRVSDPSQLVRGATHRIQVLDVFHNEPSTFQNTGGADPHYVLTLAFWTVEKNDT